MSQQEEDHLLEISVLDLFKTPPPVKNKSKTTMGVLDDDDHGDDDVLKCVMTNLTRPGDDDAQSIFEKEDGEDLVTRVTFLPTNKIKSSIALAQQEEPFE